VAEYCSIAEEYRGSWGLEGGIWGGILGCRQAHLVISKVLMVLLLSSGHLGSIRSGAWVGGANPAALIVLLLAVRTARYRA